jgi:hypothetical protein
LKPTYVNINGRNIITWNESGINGYIGSQNDKLSFVGGKWSTITQYKFYSDSFIIEFGDRILYESHYYEVVSDPKNTAHKNHHSKIKLQKIEEVTA